MVVESVAVEMGDVVAMGAGAVDEGILETSSKSTSSKST